jgi:2-oxoglutarate ferredoxin oxidoreductase subunit beta
LSTSPTTSDSDRKGLTKKETAADHPTWCPGCGDFSVLALYYKLIEKRKDLARKDLHGRRHRLLLAGFRISSRPMARTSSTAERCRYATGISVSRPDLHVFVFGGDGDAFSIGGNHFNHTARKNVKTDLRASWTTGFTASQRNRPRPRRRSVSRARPTSGGAVDYPINPMKQAISAGATFVARTTHTNPNHVLQMMEAAMDHDGFSFIECLSECVEFYEGAFDASNPRKGGVFNEVPKTHDVTDELAAYKLAGEPFPGSFGIFYKVSKPTKNAKEAEINKSFQAKTTGMKDWQILQKNFDRMK